MEIKRIKIPYRDGYTLAKVAGELTESAPLIVLHGGPGSTSIYTSSMLELLSDKRTVILYDQVSNGDSTCTASPEEWDFPLFIDQYKSVLSFFGLKNADVLGHSWGGFLGIELAVADPDTIQKLILSDTAASSDDFLVGAQNLLHEMPEEDLVAIKKYEASRDYDNKNYEAAVMRYNNRFLCRLDPWPSEVIESFERTNREMYLHMWGPSEFTCTGTLGKWDANPRLSQIEHETLIISGEFDEAQPYAQEKMLAGIPNSRWEMIPNASHLCFVEQPEKYKALVDAFLTN